MTTTVDIAMTGKGQRYAAEKSNAFDTGALSTSVDMSTVVDTDEESTQVDLLTLQIDRTSRTGRPSAVNAAAACRARCVSRSTPSASARETYNSTRNSAMRPTVRRADHGRNRGCPQCLRPADPSAVVHTRARDDEEGLVKRASSPGCRRSS